MILRTKLNSCYGKMNINTDYKINEQEVDEYYNLRKMFPPYSLTTFVIGERGYGRNKYNKRG